MEALSEQENWSSTKGGVTLGKTSSGPGHSSAVNQLAGKLGEDWGVDITGTLLRHRAHLPRTNILL